MKNAEAVLVRWKRRSRYELATPTTVSDGLAGARSFSALRMKTSPRRYGAFLIAEHGF